MFIGVRQIAIAALVALFAVLPNRAQLTRSAEWVRVSTGEITYLTRTPEPAARRAVEKLAAFGAVMDLYFPPSSNGRRGQVTLIAFADEVEYLPYKPLDRAGRPDLQISGYFQASEDANYITFAAGSEPNKMFGTMYHEFVHYVLSDSYPGVTVPAWLNEGLAEYFQTFEQIRPGKVRLGITQTSHAALLAKRELMPLEELVRASDESVHQSGETSRSAFYAQSWALVHMLVSKSGFDGIKTYLGSLRKGMDRAAAFRQAFGRNAADLDPELREYVRKRAYRELDVIVTDSHLPVKKVETISDLLASVHLADMLIRSGRGVEGEARLNEVITRDPENPDANAALGMLKLRSGSIAEARTHLAKAADGSTDHQLLYTLARLISQEELDRSGGRAVYEPGAVKEMRRLLRRALELVPTHAPSNELLAHIAAVSGEDLESALEGLTLALLQDQRNTRYLLRKGEVLRKLHRYDEAWSTADKVKDIGGNADTLRWAEELRERIRQSRRIEAQKAALIREYRESAERLGRSAIFANANNVVPPLSGDASGSLLELAQTMNTINAAIARPAIGELRVLARIDRVVCTETGVSFSITSESGPMLLFSPDIERIRMRSFVNSRSFDVACDSAFPNDLALFIFMLDPTSPRSTAGRVVSIEFVPREFAFMTGTSPIIIGQ